MDNPFIFRIFVLEIDCRTKPPKTMHCEIPKRVEEVKGSTAVNAAIYLVAITVALLLNYFVI